MSGIIPTMEQIDELHRKIAPSQAAYDLIHTHCVIVADIARRLARRRNALFMRRCTLPADAPERTGHYPVLPERASAAPHVVMSESPDSCVVGRDVSAHTSESPDSDNIGVAVAAPTDGVSGGTVPPRLIDERLVVIGGLLHDIGTYRVLEEKYNGSNGEPLEFSKKRYILHGLLGYEYLLEEGVDESIAQFARNHTGVGLTRESVIAQGLPLPPDDYVPLNLEQEAVMVADKYHSKSVPPKFVSADAYTARAARFGEDNKRRWLDLVREYGMPDVPALAEHWHMRMI